MKLNPGKLRHRITVQSRAVVSSNDGGWSPAFSTDEVRWARVQPISGAEGFRADQNDATAGFKITMRYFDGLTTKHKISWGSRTFEITAVEHIEEIDHWTVVHAQEVLS